MATMTESEKQAERSAFEKFEEFYKENPGSFGIFFTCV
jgi:hypothetical protein